ncbi:uncharacterized protein LOC106179202 [Lingula anatina]|uniref:Uncharacterized protein LOC106179202 n=1 Tax=Lingula anatina TaxID=7574 RepID=A0A1S3K6C8_LINAN|nr:uncharacterized protein LOC106179202 [Lingula anatina]|eukprot:XP_013418188.1 uncharacterized protein LOC106179202 [Lingula anatina]
MSESKDQEIEKLRLARRARKGAVTRVIGVIERAIAADEPKTVDANVSKLKEVFTSFENCHDAYHSLLETDSDIETSEAWFSQVQDSYIRGIGAGVTYMKSLKPESESEQLSEQKLINLLSLPKAEIDTFSGNPSDFYSFCAVFDETIDSKIDDKNVKLTRLLQYTSGAAKDAIKNCVLIGESGYDKAREILKARFGNDHLVAQRIINDLKSGKNVNTPDELQKLADDLQVASVTLEKLDMLSEVENQKTILDIVKRCRVKIVDKWRHKVNLTLQFDPLRSG